MRKTAKVLVSVIMVFFLVANFNISAKTQKRQINLRGFSKFVNQVLKDWKVPGLAIAIVEKDKIVYAEGFGFRNVNQKLPVTPETLFAIGSCTKAFTAVAMGILADEGKVDWDKPVKNYLPTFKLKDPFASNRMTPRDLLCHRSGLPRHDLMWYGAPATREELFLRLQYLEPNKDFREVFQYQNLMFMTAGYLVGELAGVSWEPFVKDKILEPLQMKGSNFSVEVSKKGDNFALPYTEKKKNVIEIPFRNIDQVGPAGSINSNVKEMCNWLIMNLNQGKFMKKQIVTEASLKEIHSPQMLVSKSIRYKELFYSSYGMGWMVTAYRGELLISHGGGIDGFTALVSFMPNKKTGIVVLSNRSGTSSPQIVTYNLLDRILKLKPINWSTRIKKGYDEAAKQAEKNKKEKDKDKKLNTKPSHPLKDYVGDYENPGYGKISVSRKENQLSLTYNSFPGSLTHYHYDVFDFYNEDFDRKMKVSFNNDLKGNIQKLAIKLEPAVDDIVFTRMAEKKMRQRAFLQKFVGEYELQGIVVKIYIKKRDTLYVFVLGQPEYELLPYKGNEFNFKNLTGYSIEFVMNNNGKVIEAKTKQPNGTFTAKRKN